MDIGVLGEHLAKQRRTRARQTGNPYEAMRHDKVLNQGNSSGMIRPTHATGDNADVSSDNSGSSGVS
jgi:hypothetical protein